MSITIIHGVKLQAIKPPNFIRAETGKGIKKENGLSFSIGMLDDSTIDALADEFKVNLHKVKRRQNESEQASIN